MIGRIRGILIEKLAPDIVVEVQGVGYEIQSPMSTIYQLPALGNEVALYTHLVVREDAHLLYGFLSLDERHMFRSLIKISGVGPNRLKPDSGGHDAAQLGKSWYWSSEIPSRSMIGPPCAQLVE